MVNDVLNNIERSLIDKKIKTLEEIRLQNEPIVAFSNEMQSYVNTIRMFLSERMYNHQKVRSMTKNAEKIITSLYGVLIKDNDLIYTKLKIKKNDKISKTRMICDFIAGMTDNYAQSIYQEYC